MNYDVDKYITKLTVMELKTIINECLKEFEEEKQSSEEQYKQLWIKPTVVTEDGFKCGS